MKILIQTGNVLQEASNLTVLGGCFEDIPLPVEVAGSLEPGDFGGRAGQSVTLPLARLAPGVCCWSVWATVRKPQPRQSGGKAPLPLKKPKSLK